MAQTKKSPAKSASKSAEPRKADKGAHPKKQVARTAAPAKAAKPTPGKAQPVSAKSKSAKPAAAKAPVKAKAAVPAPVKAKAKMEVTATTKKTAAPVRPADAKAAAGKPAAAPAKAPVKAAAKSAPAPVVASGKPAGKVPAAKAPAADKVSVAAVIAGRAKAPAAPAARAIPAAVHKPAARMMTSPSMPVLPAQPTMPRSAVVSPKELALKAAEAKRQQMLAAPKKPVNSRHGFKIGESIVYPAHGVGQIVGIEEQEIAGMTLELFVIQIEKDKLTLRVPTAKLEQTGVRKLAEDNIVSRAMETLKGRARVKRTMWSRRAQEYEAKINSGDLIAIAEVVRDLYRSETQPEQSYSERQLYESALDRMAREIAVVDKLDERTAMQRITEVLSRSARGRRVAEESTGDTQAA